MKANKFAATNSSGALTVTVIGENMISSVTLKKNPTTENMLELGKKLKSITPNPVYMIIKTISGGELFKEKY